MKITREKLNMLYAEYYNLDKNMAYTIAAYHDIAFDVDRENHNIASAKVLENDKELTKYFSKEQIKIIEISEIK